MRRLILLLVLLTMLFCGGCAVFNRANTPLLNFVEQNMIPGENPGRAMFYPLAIPIGMTAVTLDMFLIHPATVVGDAWDDTLDVLWRGKLDWENHYMTTSAWLLPRVAATPLVAGTSFLARSAFDVPHRGSSPLQADNEETRKEMEKKLNEQKNKLAQARQSLANGDRDTALRVSEEILANDGSMEEAAVIKATVLLGRRELDTVTAISRIHQLFSDNGFATEFVKLMANGTSVDRMKLLSILDASLLPFQGKSAASAPLVLNGMEKCLTDNDRAIQMKVLQLLGKFQRNNARARLLLEEAAQGSDQVLAAAAKGLLR